MNLNQPENKFKHIVFGYSKLAFKKNKIVRMAKVSIELQNAGYTFYKRSNRWVLAEKLTGEIVHTSANLTNLDYYLDKYIMPKVYLRDAKDIYEKYVSCLKGEYDFNLADLEDHFEILAVNLDIEATTLWNKVRECKTDLYDRVYNKVTKNQYKKLMQNKLVWALYEDLMYEGNVKEWHEILKKPIKEIIKIAEKNDKESA